MDADSGKAGKKGSRDHLLPAQQKSRCRRQLHIPQFLYHDFEVEPGTGTVLLGEVSQCNDDANDNRFNPVLEGRFPAIEEDEAPYRLLCTEYPAAE